MSNVDTSIPNFLKRKETAPKKPEKPKLLEVSKAMTPLAQTAVERINEARKADGLREYKQGKRDAATKVPKKAGKLVAKAIEQRDALKKTAKEQAAKSASKPNDAENPKSKSAKPKAKRDPGKKDAVIAAIKKGATMKELEKVTGWTAHSVRAFISGTLRAKLKMKVNADANKDGVYVYTFKK